MSSADSFEFEEDEDAPLGAAVVSGVSVAEDKDLPKDPPAVAEGALTQRKASALEEVESPSAKQETSKQEGTGEHTQQESMQGTIGEMLIGPMSLSPPKQDQRTKRKPVKHPKPREIREDPVSSLPVLSKDTENRDTYDLDFLLETQKQAKAKHRFAKQLEAPQPVRCMDLVPERDYVRKHIEENQPARTNQVGLSLSAEQLLPRQKSPKHQPANFVKRLYQYRDHVQEKLKQTKEQLIQDEMELCTFKPTIAKFNLQRGKRNPEDLYYEGQSRAKENEKKLERMKADMEPEPSPFRPEINAKSVQMLEKKGRGGSTPVYEQLYSLPKAAVTQEIREGAPHSLTVNQDPELTFKPSINKRSEALTREKPVQIILYEDAKKRSEKSEPKVEPSKPALLSKNSARVLMKKFESEFENAWRLAGAEGELSSSEQLEHCLDCLYFAPDSGLQQPTKTMWEALVTEARPTIKQANLLAFLKVVMRFKSGFKVVSGDSEAAFGRFEGDKLVFSRKDLKKIQTTFQNLYEARLSIVNKSSLHPHYRSLESFPFRPDINKSPGSSMSSIKYVEQRLLAETEKVKEKLQKIKDEVDREQMAECTFSPTIRKSKFDGERSLAEEISISSWKSDRNEELYRLATVVRSRKEELAKSYAENDMEQYEKHCTFYPNTDLTEAEYKDESEGRSEGVESTIERMRKARDAKEKLKVALERGEPSQYLPGSDFRHGIERTFKGAVKTTEEEVVIPAPLRIATKRQRSPKRAVSPPRIEKAPSPAVAPPKGPQWTPEEMMKKLQAIPQNEVMTVSVLVRPGQSEDLTLYEGDDLTSVVSAFAQKHGINQEDMFKLRSLISNQLLTKDY